MLEAVSYLSGSYGSHGVEFYISEANKNVVCAAASCLLPIYRRPAL